MSNENNYVDNYGAVTNENIIDANISEVFQVILESEKGDNISSYTAKEMLEEFESNMIRAKDEFDGVYISVTGVVEIISINGDYI